ncbi:MAG TPA: chloride channel protein [Gemmatimonadaceae bacterium]
MSLTTLLARGRAALLSSGRALLDLSSEEARERRLLVDTVLLGLVGALAAQLFNALLRSASSIFLGGIAGYHPPGLPNEGASPNEIIGPYGLWLVPLSMMLGGLLVGILTEWLAPEAEGHGTDAAIKAFHRTDGVLRPRVAPIKMIASALTIGSGGVAGREGPMALITGTIGSWYATRTGREDRERRTLLLVGMACGLAAIFRSPIGAALLSVEVLYADMEFEPDALLYTTLGAITAYAVNGLFVGWDPLFRVSSLAGQLPRAIDYAWYIVLGLAAGIVATVLPVLFYRTRDLFRRLPVRPFLRPAIGGLVAGLIALAVPKVIAGGYGWIQQAIDGRLALSTLAILIVAKMAAMSATVGSGGSGGVFAPTLFTGSMLGGAIAMLFHQPAAPFVVVGMAAVFAGAAHVPIATMMMVTEMTGGYQLLVPATLAVVISYLVQTRLSRGLHYRSVYEAQVPNRGDSPAHHTKHLEIALQIMQQKGFQDLANQEERRLLSLLRSGIPVNLPGGRGLFVATLRETSELARRPLQEGIVLLNHDAATIIAVIRGEHMMAPRPDLVLEPGDRAILVVTANAMDNVRVHFEPW